MDLEKLKGIIAENCSGVDESEITEDSTFESLGLDSLDLAQIVFAVEEQLEVEIDADMLEEIVTVGDALEAIQEAQR